MQFHLKLVFQNTIINHIAHIMADNEEMEAEVMSEVELSSDEEEQNEDDEVSLIVLKRPPVITRTVQDIEVTCSFLTFISIPSIN